MRYGTTVTRQSAVTFNIVQRSCRSRVVSAIAGVRAFLCPFHQAVTANPSESKWFERHVALYVVAKLREAFGEGGGSYPLTSKATAEIFTKPMRRFSVPSGNIPLGNQ